MNEFDEVSCEVAMQNHLGAQEIRAVNDSDMWDPLISEWHFELIDPVLVYNLRFLQVMIPGVNKGKRIVDIFAEASAECVAKVKGYAIDIERGDQFRPITIEREGDKLGIYDGCHRLCAYYLLRRKVPAYVRIKK